MTSIDFTITQSSIDYGRIYFDAVNGSVKMTTVGN